VEWFEDDNEINVLVVHGSEKVIELIVDDKVERKIEFQPIAFGVLSYDPLEARLKVGGVAKAHRGTLAEVFAATMLVKPGFFARDDSQDLSTLAPVEQSKFKFAFDHRYDPTIKRVRVVEAEAVRALASSTASGTAAQYKIVVHDPIDALARMGNTTNVAFPPYRLSGLSFRIEFDSATGRSPGMTVRLASKSTAAFKRDVHEARIMELLRRNGLTIGKRTGEAASEAAE
jgi:hypothetical protein